MRKLLYFLNLIEFKGGMELSDKNLTGFLYSKEFQSWMRADKQNCYMVLKSCTSLYLNLSSTKTN